jgi:hypothetical protein
MKMANRSFSGGICGHTPITPCNSPADPTGFHGEVENYTLNISVATNVAEKGDVGTFVKAYPNPFVSFVTLESNLKEAKVLDIAIFDVAGKVVKTVSIADMVGGINKIPIDLSELHSGFYVCKIKSGDYFKSIKLLKD